MASRKLVRDLLLSRQSIFVSLTHQKDSTTRLRLLPAHGLSAARRFSVFNEFSKRVKGEAEKNPEFQKSVKELKEKAEELKGVKEDIKVRTKQKTEQLYKQVDEAWTEAEAKAKQVSHNVKEKISAATEEVKESFGIGNQNASASTGPTDKKGADVKHEQNSSSTEDKNQHSGSSETAYTFFSKFKSSITSPNVSSSFRKIKEAKFVDVAKKGFDIVKEELAGNPTKKRHLTYEPSATKAERSTRTDVVVMPSKQSAWSKKWQDLKEKIQSHRMFKSIKNVSEPVSNKGQEFMEDMRERIETSDSPIIHKIQDINDSMFQESDAAITYKEIRNRDPYFSLPEFVTEVQETIRPVLNAYLKGDVETLSKYCSPELIERCKAEHKAYQSHGIFFDNKILHVSDVEVKETKMMGSSPIIILMFQTQQIYCVRDRNGEIAEGGKDTIHTVFYAWAMQQVDPEEIGEGAIYPIWRLREMQQQGIRALI